MYVTGIPRKVNVDAYVPAIKNKNPFKKDLFVPAFAQISGSGAMWPIILEKAWAKLFGT